MAAAGGGSNEGKLYVWGGEWNGELGLGTGNIKVSSPTQLGADTDWASVHGSSTGATLAIKTDGTLWSWGQDYSGTGVLGHGDVIQRSSPVQIGSLTTWATAGTAGYASFAIKTDGTLWSWGKGNSGQTGHGDRVDRSSPTQVGSLTNWATVGQRGPNGPAFAIKTDGTLWGWGSGSNGASGHGDTIGRSSPVQVGSLTNWRSISCGNLYVVATKTDNTMWSWGRCLSGALGHGDDVSRSSPTQIGSLTTWSKATFGMGGPVALAIKTDGTAWAWGFNTHGQTGQGDTIVHSSPVQIGSLTDWSTPRTGGYFQSAIKTDGTLWTWGRGDDGQLGNGLAINLSSPVQIGSQADWGGVGTPAKFANFVIKV
jgi:alpha-tubulin suppressor-like RCC1 family protein